MNRSVFGASLLSVAIAVAGIPARAALIPPFMIESVVALGTDINVNQPGAAPEVKWQTVGTGFFYAYKVKDDPDQSKRKYAIYLVTAGHVVREFMDSNPGDLLVRINPKQPGVPSKTFNVPRQGGPNVETWFFHPNFRLGVADNDIAAVRVNADKINELGAAFVQNDDHAANAARLKELGVSAGDGAFVLGFPMQLAGAQRNYVIVRHGIIARISELLDGASTTFMLDAFVFPGNSGSPVVLRPEIAAIQGTASVNKAYVIGIVEGYETYRDVAVSTQTRRERVAFEENSGLADVIPMDRVDEAIAAHEKH